MASDIYSVLGISVSEKKASSQIAINHVGLLNHCEAKKKYTNSLNELLKYIKSKKTSKEITKYGFVVDYKLSKKVQVLVNFLTQLDANKPLDIMKDREANIKVDISL